MRALKNFGCITSVPACRQAGKACKIPLSEESRHQAGRRVWNFASFHGEWSEIFPARDFCATFSKKVAKIL